MYFKGQSIVYHLSLCEVGTPPPPPLPPCRPNILVHFVAKVMNDKYLIDTYTKKESLWRSGTGQHLNGKILGSNPGGKLIFHIKFKGPRKHNKQLNLGVTNKNQDPLYDFTNI